MTEPASTAPVIEQELAEQLVQHVGKWVAVDLQRVVGFGSTAAEALQMARESGHTDPLVFQVALHPSRVAFF